MDKLLIITFCSLLFSFSKAQPDCSHPLGEIHSTLQSPTCYVIDSGDTTDVCFTFTSPGNILLFTSVPGGSCSTIEATATLYDSACNVVIADAFGVFLNVTAGESYTWCLHYVCTGTHNTTFCPFYQDFSALPVNLEYFRGRYSGNCHSVEIDWATAGEFDNNYFVLEHTKGKDFPFVPLVQMPGNGTTSSSHTYHYSDYKFSSGYNFYRLKQIDFNGAVSFSNVIMVKTPEQISQQWIVYDLAGRRLKKISTEEMNTLAEGFYILKAQEAIKKIIK